MSKPGKKGSNPGGLLSTQEVATVIGVSHPTLLKLLREKRIPEPQVHGNARHWSGADVRHAQIVVAALRESGELRMKGRA
jgi:excisionase family DNA binding protein